MLQVSLLTDSGGTKDDLKLPTDDNLSALVSFLSFFFFFMYMNWDCDNENNLLKKMQMKSGFEEGKDVVVSVMSSMGEEQICAVKEVGGGK